MRISIVTLIAICCGCSGTVQDPDGHYVLESYTQHGRYFTLDVSDSIVLLNKSSVFQNQRDTFRIDPQNGRFLSTSSNLLNVHGFRMSGDSVILSYGTNSDGAELVFVRSKEDPAHDPFSNSLLEVDLLTCVDSCGHTHLQESYNLRHLLVGPAKPGVAPGIGLRPDSVLMEFHNMTFLALANLEALTREMKKAGEQLCLDIDKDTPAEKVTKLRSELQRHAHGMMIFESKMKDGHLVLVESPANERFTLK